MSIVWSVGSILAGNLLLRHGPSRLVIAGTTSLLAGASVLALVDEGTNQLIVAAALAVMGFGMGMILTSYLVSVQNRVPRGRMGVATSSLQFVFQIGGTVGVSVLGAVMASRLSQGLASLPGGEGIDVMSVLDSASGLRSAAIAGRSASSGDALHPAFVLAVRRRRRDGLRFGAGRSASYSTPA